MPDNTFILNNIRWSYSSLSTFKTCPLAFKLSYIDSLERTNNFYAEYGLLVHEILEKYFKKEVEIWDLSSTFKLNFDLMVKSPSGIPGLEEKYYQQGISFFDSFDVSRDLYDVMFLEEKINFDYEGYKFVAKPDLVLKEKTTNLVSLWDYKSSTLYKKDRKGIETEDAKKIEEYKKQMSMYTFALRLSGIKVDKINLLFTRAKKLISFPVVEKDETDIMQWALNTIEDIYKEEYNYNNTQNYFCNNLCGVRLFCEFH